VIYLIHFDRPYRHARHYLGYCRTPEDLAARLARHRAGRGARLLRVVQGAGIGWHVARTWPDGDRTRERRLKNNRNGPRYCPVCRLQARASG
jgi:predicted GIY-YIG superfamily endonuclease